MNFPRELTNLGGNVVKMAEVESPMEIESKAVQPAAVPTAPKQSGYELPWSEFILTCFHTGGAIVMEPRHGDYILVHCFLSMSTAGSRSIVQCN